MEDRTVNSLLVSLLLGTLSGASPGGSADDDLREQAARALRRATEYFRKDVATEGGYLWRYSEDLSRREGEGKATATQIWVQPPGTPSVGMAFLTAYEATGDKYYLEAARDAAHALVRGQLRSGGWYYVVDFDPANRKKLAYRDDGGGSKARNTTTLDDNTTQSALRLLMRVDRALEFNDARVHDAAQYALNAILKAQYPNGAWTQVFVEAPDAEKFPVKKASYPESWSRTWPGGDYWFQYTFNDNALADVIDTLFEASRVYNEPRYRAAAQHAGDFILLAQMPEPQPAWAQQYDADMHPAWARKFEPPSVTGGESQGVMRILMQIYRETGDQKYLEPIPRAIAYLRRSALPDGRLSRFYELKSNKPLYLTKDYQLTYDDSDMPTHYGFKVGHSLDAIEREFERLKATDPSKLKLKTPAKPNRPQLTPVLEAHARVVIAALDDRGRWVEDGRLRYHGPNDPTTRIIECQTFIKNVETLSRYLAAIRP
jgi:PelA/Pel-15E family pectate lyase